MRKSLVMTGIIALLIVFTAIGAYATANPYFCGRWGRQPAAPTAVSLLTMPEAVELAQDKFGGEFENIELDRENGRLIYEVELLLSGHKLEVELEASSGVVIKVQRERLTPEKALQQKNYIAPTVSLQAAIDIALTDTEGQVIEVEYDAKDQEYEVEILTGNQKVEIEIDARTGQIIDKEAKSYTEKAMAQNNYGAPVTSKGQSGTAARVKTPSLTTGTGQLITMEEAIDIALADTAGQVIEVEYDAKDQEYEVEILTGTQKVDMEIDARTGRITDKEIKSYSKKTVGQSTHGAPAITMEEAISIALADTAGQVVEIEYDAKDQEYEVEIKTADKKVEIEIDARTGRITDKEVKHYRQGK